MLGALSVQPMTGYEIRQGITSILGHFWHESFGQIYPCLSTLVADGFVERRRGQRSGSAVFAITEAGRRRLTERLREAPAPQSPRNATLLRIFFGSNLSSEDLESLLDDTERKALSQLAELAAIRVEIGSDPVSEVHGRYWLATINAGEISARATLDWVRQTRHDLLGVREDASAPD